MKILLAEDSADLADAIATCLQRAGHALTVAEDGEIAASLLARERFDLVALDLNLPAAAASHCSGRCAPARTAPPSSSSPARGAVDDRVSLLDLGADDFLAKPFDLRELEARVRACSGGRWG